MDHEEAASLFQVLSHRGRLEILDELRRGEACVCHLQATMHRPQVYVSQQLRILRDNGLVVDRREATFVYYRLADAGVERLLGDVLGPPAERVCVENCPCPKCQQQDQGE
jgi:ArsR family transcriptional regulator